VPATVAIVDSGLCNLDSIRRAVEQCGGTPRIVRDPAPLGEVDRIVLPGVGSFAAAMRNLAAAGFDRALPEELARRRVPFLGICLGMQLMAERSEEGGATKGLGLLPGDVVRLVPRAADERVPHIGWNEIEAKPGAALFDGTASGTDFYFVHSYHVRCGTDWAAAKTPYCGGFVSAVERGHVFGVQFHPEKSQKAGFDVLRRFLAL
jgi:glutamine amidotransferase